MRRTLDSRLFLLICFLAASSTCTISASTTTRDRAISNIRATQTDTLDRILTSIPTRNPWARWGLEWARWGKDFARMWQLPYPNERYPDSPYNQRYPQSSPNGAPYPPELQPYGNKQQRMDRLYPGESPYDRQTFDEPYVDEGRGRYGSSGRRPLSPSYNRNPSAAYDQSPLGRTGGGYQPYYGSQSPRALTSPYYSNDVRSPQELSSYEGAGMPDEYEIQNQGWKSDRNPAKLGDRSATTEPKIIQN